MGADRFDVIVVGSRVGGAATALLLARAGLRVLAVDRARLPSDTLSTHQVQVPGVAALHRWGLLDRLDAAGTPPVNRVKLDWHGTVLDGRFPAHGGVDALYSPRRTLLDAVLVEAARSAGAQVRDGVTVQELLADRAPGPGDRVTGIRGRDRSGRPVVATARWVVGADGKRSTVATAVGAAGYRAHPARTVACYAYWAGLPLDRGELYQRPGCAAAAFPTNDGLSVVFLSLPLDELGRLRADVSAGYLAALDRCGDLGERVRAARRVERFRIAPDLPNHLRVPAGPGWALVGDAGMTLDPVTAQGISQAFVQAELAAASLVDAITTGDDRRVARYRRARDAAAVPMFDFTVAQAALGPPGARERFLLEAIRDDPADVTEFLGVFAGSVPLDRYRSLRRVLRRIGPRGVPGLAAAQARALLHRAA